MGTFCDCSKKTTVIIHQVRPNDVKDVERLFENANGDLMKVIQQDQMPEVVQKRTVKFRTSDDEEENQLGLRIAIVDVAKRCLEIVACDKGDEEAICRFLAVNDLTVNLTERFRDKKAITKSESHEIRKRAEQISRYGSSAAYLWDYAKNMNDADQLRRKHFPNQLKLVMPILEDRNLLQGIYRRRFADLDRDVKAVFLEAAEKSPKSDDAGFKSWSDRDFDFGDIKESDEKDRSQASGVQMEEVDVNKSQQKVELD